MSGWDQAAEDKIRAAIKKGAFDNLPGTGKPLNLDEDPTEDPELRITHRILRRNGHSLPWIEENKDIDTSLDAARRTLSRAWKRYQDELAEGTTGGWADTRWKQAQDTFRKEVAELNRRILTFNLKAPLIRFQRTAIQIEKEISSIMDKA